MKAMFLTAFAGATLVGGTTLSTKYATDRAIKFEIESTMTMETTSMEGERDGEPIDSPGGHGMKTETTYNEVHLDRVLETAEGKPIKMRRTFEKIGGTMNMTMGDQDNSSDIESPFKGVTLELSLDKEGAVECDVVEGKKPDHEKAMEGHRLDQFLDGLLPKDAVEVDGTWDLEKDAIARALRLDVRRNLYPPPERGDGAGGGRGGGGGGRRGGMRMGGGGGSMLEGAAWKGTAKLVSADKDVDGVACAVVELKLEASGEREMPAMRGRRGQMFAPESFALENKSTYEVRLEGKFYFATKEKRPVKLDLEGTVHTDSRMEFTREESTMKMHTVQDGKVEFKVDVSVEAVEVAKKESKGDK